MEWRIAGEVAAVAAEFLIDGEYVTPDGGNITVTIRGNTGVIISGYDSLPITSLDPNKVVYSVPADVNEIAVDALFETRYATFYYTVDANPYTVPVVYRLTPFLGLQLTPNNVRDLIGVQETELPNSVIAMEESYFDLLSIYGTDFTTAMSSSNRATIAANKMVALKAAINVLPSLQARMFKIETSHNETRERNKMDFERLKNDLMQALAEAAEVMLEEVGNAAAFNTSHFLVVTPTDPITGA